MTSLTNSARAFAAALLLTAAGCDRSVTEPPIAGVHVAVIILRTSGGEFIFTHRDHWHGAPLVPVNGTETLEIYFSEIRMADDDHEPPPVESWFTLVGHSDLNVAAVIEDPSIATWTGTRTSGTFHGLEAGASRISFVVKRGSTTLLEAPPLNFRVQ